MVEPGVCHAEWRKSDTEKQILYINACIWNLANGTDEAVCRTGIDRCGGQIVDGGGLERGG